MKYMGCLKKHLLYVKKAHRDLGLSFANSSCNSQEHKGSFISKRAVFLRPKGRNMAIKAHPFHYKSLLSQTMETVNLNSAITPNKWQKQDKFILWWAVFWASLSSVGKESTCNAGDPGSIPGLGRSPGEGKRYPFQYSGLENSKDCRVHGVAKSWTRLSDFHFYLFLSALGLRC